MIQTSDTSGSDDRFDLNRFISAQARIYDRVLTELRNGQKRTHWMWYIFPQLDGLGHSTTAKHYGIKSREEAQEYLNHPVLGARLLECVEVVFAIEGRSVSKIFGHPDYLKFKSSLTLFSLISEPNSVFDSVLDKYFQGERDVRTLQLWEKLKEKSA